MAVIKDYLYAGIYVLVASIAYLILLVTVVRLLRTVNSIRNHISLTEL